MKLQQIIEQVQAVKGQYEEALLELANVVGVGIGFKEIAGKVTDQIAIIANVTRKLPLDQLNPGDVVPPRFDGVPTDVQEVGQIKPLERAAAKEASFFEKLMEDLKELSQKWDSTLESYWPWSTHQPPSQPKHLPSNQAANREANHDD